MRNLNAALTLYCGLDHDGVHGTLADATVTAAVLEGMLARYADPPRTVAGRVRITDLGS